MSNKILINTLNSSTNITKNIVNLLTRSNIFDVKIHRNERELLMATKELKRNIVIIDSKEITEELINELYLENLSEHIGILEICHSDKDIRTANKNNFYFLDVSNKNYHNTIENYVKAIERVLNFDDMVGTDVEGYIIPGDVMVYDVLYRKIRNEEEIMKVIQELQLEMQEEDYIMDVIEEIINYQERYQSYTTRTLLKIIYEKNSEKKSKLKEKVTQITKKVTQLNNIKHLIDVPTQEITFAIIVRYLVKQLEMRVIY